MGLIERLFGNKDPREAKFREAIRIDPDDIEAHLNLGQLLNNLHRFEEAEKEIREVIRINPNNADTHYILGLLLDTINVERYAKVYGKAYNKVM